MGDGQSNGPVALVLAGGGARGAYEAGALAVLLPELERRGQRPQIIIGNSVGAINATYLAARADVDARQLAVEGTAEWQKLRFGDVFQSLFSLGSVRRVLQFAGQALGVRGARLESLLGAAPLSATIPKLVEFDRLHANVRAGLIRTVAVVASSALTRGSVVFHSGGQKPPRDRNRGIEYAPCELGVEHVLASAAIPAVFPPICIAAPQHAGGYYVDGGTRLNVPIKPALEFGAARVVVIGLSSYAQGGARIAGPSRPDAFAGISDIVQGLLDDQMVQDVHTLAHINEHVAPGGGYRKVPYILITPNQPRTIERIAFEVYRGHRWLARSWNIGLLGRATGARSAAENATLLSMLFFDPDFIARLIERGEEDARRWVQTVHDPAEPLWQVDAL